MQRLVPFAEGEFYHIYNRGTDKRTLFYDEKDHIGFVERLYLANCSESINVRDVKRLHNSVFEYVRSDQLVAVGSYCLMPNHFHLLLTPLVEGGVAKFMSKLMTGYSMYFNKKYERSGTLYEGPFKANHADFDQYLKYLYAYIHLNPLKLMSGSFDASAEECLEFLRSYSHSSLPDYLGIEREVNIILHKEFFPQYFTTTADQIKELKDWLNFETPHILP